MPEVLGGFEHQVLLAIMRLDEEAYTVPVVRVLEASTGRSVGPSAVYVTLRRLEKRGLLTSELVAPAEGEGGRNRRVFRITPEAVTQLRDWRRELDRLWDGLEALEP
ncbi:MAG: PadR family transcriptional regulator [Gemmatimonadota bacterium]|jgi:DNA-binding PadR family transcriptional regulator